MVIRPGRAPIRSSGGGVRTTLASILSKYSGSHHWDFGVSADKVAAGASMTPAQFLAAYPNHNLYQDAAGTTPAFLPTHPVGLCLDQPSGSVVLGSTIFSDDFSSGSVAGYQAANSAGLSVVSGAMRIQHAGANYPGAAKTLTTVANMTYVVTFGIVKGTSSAGIAVRVNDGLPFAGGTGLADSLYKTASGNYQVFFKAASSVTHLYSLINTTTLGQYDDIDNISVKEVLGSHASQSSTTKRPVLSGRVNMLLATATLSTQSVTTLAASYKLTFTGSGTVTLSGTYVGSLVGGGSLTFTATAGTLTLTVTGLVTVADLRPANSPTNIPAYQRVTTSTDYDTVGFPLRAVWDGVDDRLVVPTLDLSITDKVTVVAGVTKQSDAALGAVIETGINRTESGAFGLRIPSAASTALIDVGATGVGTGAGVRVTTSAYPAPVASVVSTQIDLAIIGYGALKNVNVNGSSTALNGGFGAGNIVASVFGSLPAYIGSYSTAGYFSGPIQSITLLPALITASETTVIESHVNNEMKKVY